MMGIVSNFYHGPLTISLQLQHVPIWKQEPDKHYWDTRCIPEEKIYLYFLREHVAALSAITTRILLSKDTTVWHIFGHPFLELVIHLHRTRVRKHLFACHDTCKFLAATQKARFETDPKCPY